MDLAVPIYRCRRPRWLNSPMKDDVPLTNSAAAARAFAERVRDWSFTAQPNPHLPSRRDSTASPMPESITRGDQRESDVSADDSPRGSDGRRSEFLLVGTRPPTPVMEITQLEKCDSKILLYLANPSVGNDATGLMRELAALHGVCRVVPLSKIPRLLRIEYDRSVIVARALLVRVRRGWSAARLVGM